MTLKEAEIEQKLIDKLQDLKYAYRPDIRDKAALEQNFRAKFEALNHVQLTDAEFARLRDDIIGADVFQAAKTAARIRLLSARGRHPAALHAGQPQGLVQERLRGRPPAAHQHR